MLVTDKDSNDRNREDLEKYLKKINEIVEKSRKLDVKIEGVALTEERQGIRKRYVLVVDYWNTEEAL